MNWVVDLHDTGSSVYPEARPNWFREDEEVDHDRYVFGESAMAALNKAVERLNAEASRRRT